MKICATCGESKPEEFFSKSKARKGGFHVHCKPCDNKRIAEWRKQHPTAAKEWREKNPNYHKDYNLANPIARRRQFLKWTYGLSLEDFDGMLHKQLGLCGICGKTLIKPVVDHDHITGKIRGLLCVGCNTALGLFSDSSEMLKKADDYLKRNS